MKRKSVLYYTSSHFADAMLEIVKAIKDTVDLYLIIEINPFSRNSTIVNIDQYKEYSSLVSISDVLDVEVYQKWSHYLDGLAGAHFYFYTSKQSFSLKTYVEGNKLKKWIKVVNPDIIHFDTISSRAFALLPLLKQKAVVISLHDAKPHPGEHSWKEHITNYLFYKHAKYFVFYSEYVLNSFQHSKFGLGKYLKISLIPYRFHQLKDQVKIKKPLSNTILFFGRLSYYKGIDLLLIAFEQILQDYPEWKLIIAGKEVYGYQLNRTFIKKYSSSIIWINRHIKYDELATLIDNCSFVVCPYRESSQSGVLMTALALHKCVLATKTGAFEEYIQDGYNGFLCEPDPIDIRNKISMIILKKMYMLIEENIAEINYNSTVTNIKNSLTHMYEKIT